MKKTRYVRVRLDFTIVLKEEIDSADVIGPREADRIRYALYALLTGDERVIGIAPGMKTETGLDARRRSKDHKLEAK